MPKVGNTEFPYTKEGMAKAKAWSEMTGKPIKYPKLKSKKLKERKSKNWTGTKTEAELFKEGRITQDVTPKFREKKSSCNLDYFNNKLYIYFNYLY